MTRVELGSGKNHREGWVNIDIYPYEGVDIVADLTKKFPLEDNSVDHIYSADFLEHIPSESKIHIMNEIWRVLKLGGIMEHSIPLAGTRNDFGSPSHISHWHPQQFDHFDVDSYRYAVDHEYEGFKGGFKKVLVEYSKKINGEEPQSFHVIYRKVEPV